MNDFDDYQQRAAKTAGGTHRELRALLGLVGEAGECAEVNKKFLRGDYSQGKALELLRAEVGDVLWYIAELCTVHGWRLSDIARENIAKLRERHGDDCDEADVREIPADAKAFSQPCNCVIVSKVHGPYPREHRVSIGEPSYYDDTGGLFTCDDCGFTQLWHRPADVPMEMPHEPDDDD